VSLSTDPPASPGGHGFGAAPVFLAAVSTILGAILFLRFGYAVGHVGMLGAVGIVLISHAITIPTALAVSEIATNLKVEGGGEYFIISRSFGLTVGGAIGLSLYLSQAISVAFYILAFAEVFRPLYPLFEAELGLPADPRWFALPAAGLLLLVILLRGANLGVGALYVVASILGVSLLAFFLGTPESPPERLDLLARVDDPDPFSRVFAIVFPAFTGMTAGVGLSGDLRNPRRAIPLGTLAGTLTGMVVYLLVIGKLGTALTPEELAADGLVMSRIALWGPLIPIGLGAATLSSALGSILVAPRTLQALGADGILPGGGLNRLLARGRGDANEPVNATLFTAVIVLLVISLGSVDFVAQIISMFFMVTYGALCAISFLQHFAGNPQYRPTFRSRWYLSLGGLVVCLVMMWEMQPAATVVAWAAMGGLYLLLRARATEDEGISAMVQGTLFQLTRNLRVTLQQRTDGVGPASWRPSIVALSNASLTRLAPFDLLRWLSQHHGFGTFVHFIEGQLDRRTAAVAQQLRRRLVEQTRDAGAGIVCDTVVSPSFRTAVAQLVQLPGFAGLDNNTMLLEFPRGDHRTLPEIVDGCRFAAHAGMSTLVLRSTEHHFGYHRTIHVWLTPGNYRHANLMILLAYILVGHPEWRHAEITLFAALDEADLDAGARRLETLIAAGRIPISRNNVVRVPLPHGSAFPHLVHDRSADADLVILAFSVEKLQADGGAFFRAFEGVQDLLFVRAAEEVRIIEEESLAEEAHVPEAGVG
jgi:solute carrier family 12 (sodium/potassium/chloride transporter), member 2